MAMLDFRDSKVKSKVSGTHMDKEANKPSVLIQQSEQIGIETCLYQCSLANFVASTK